jgi:hypothetical protein
MSVRVALQSVDDQHVSAGSLDHADADVVVAALCVMGVVVDIGLPVVPVMDCLTSAFVGRESGPGAEGRSGVLEFDLWLSPGPFGRPLENDTEILAASTETSVTRALVVSHKPEVGVDEAYVVDIACVPRARKGTSTSIGKD